MAYLDTSVLVAALTNEARTLEMQEWLAEQSPGELTISDWVATEFSGALSLKVRTGQLGLSHRSRVLAVFTQLATESFSVLPVSREDFHTAARFADRADTGLRSGDALHLAVASNRGLRLVALDQGLVRAAETIGVDAALL
jgi:hypothetical protein